MEALIVFMIFSRVMKDEDSAYNIGYMSPLDYNVWDRFLPDLIRGDLDSIREEVKAYYLSEVGGLSILNYPSCLS